MSRAEQRRRQRIQGGQEDPIALTRALQALSKATRQAMEKARKFTGHTVLATEAARLGRRQYYGLSKI